MELKEKTAKRRKSDTRSHDLHRVTTEDNEVNAERVLNIIKKTAQNKYRR